MKKKLIHKWAYRLILWAMAIYTLTTTAGQLCILFTIVLVVGFVVRLVFALACRLLVGFVFLLIIILLII